VAVVIEELEVQTQPQPAAPPAAANDGGGGGAGAVDERALQAALAREAWRHERLGAD
jgi:hypothetical protein